LERLARDLGSIRDFRRGLAQAPDAAGPATDDPDNQARWVTLTQALQQLGWIEGRNLQIDYRLAEGNADRARKFAARGGLTLEIAVAPKAKAARGRLLNSSPMIVDQAAINVGFGFRRYSASPAAQNPKSANDGIS
jgi:putative tryptophan/tyrosine transport system substrate-binding protein